MRAKIYSPARNAMQSGQAKTGEWVLEFEPEAPKMTDPLMGWSGSRGTSNQVRIKFESLDAAASYATSKGYAYSVIEAVERTRKPNVRKLGYAENFQANRRAPWTH